MSSLPTSLPPAASTDVLYLVDLSGYVFRAYHAVAPLSSPSGEPTHATYGTTAMLARLIEERRPAYIAAALDAPGPRTRTALDPRYKAHRPPAPEDLQIQLKRARELVEAYGLATFEAPGYEADDVIAALIAQARKNGLRVVIASADKDLMQLVDGEHVVVWDTMRDKVYGVPEVTTKFGVPPSQLRDLLALVGDTSDNVPGVPGVGLKTAAELLTEFGSFDGIYASLDKVKRQRLRDSLQANEAEARLSRELVTLVHDIPISFDLATLKYQGPSNDRLRPLFEELGFTRFLKALPSASKPTLAISSSVDVRVTRESLVEFARMTQGTPPLCVIAHTTKDDAQKGDLYALSLAWKGGPVAYVPLAHRYLGSPPQASLSDVREVLGPILADSSVPKVGYDLKFIEVTLARHGLPFAGGSVDTLLGSYLLDSEADHALDSVAERLVGQRLEEATAKKTAKKTAPQLRDDLEIQAAATQASRRAQIEMALAQVEDDRIRHENLERLMVDLELPLSRVLAKMEETGVLVDPTKLDELRHEMSRELTELEAKAREAAGQEINIASPKQLETILFDTLGLKSIKKTKTGRSTDAEVLEVLADDHPLPGIVLEHRGIAKLKGTYVDALPKLINPRTGRIHTRWNQAVAATGRISSQDPNLQNIPIRTALGKLIRQAFVPSAGSLIVSADYSQIELRVLAHLSKDPVLLDAFAKGQDIHLRTAMEIFRVDENAVTPEMRRSAKAVNFGVIYGMGEVALAKRVGVSRAEAASFIDRYFERYRGVEAFMTKTMAEARRTEVVFTLFGRRRYVRDIRSGDRFRRAQAERIAQNTPVQGTAADLLKMAMVKMPDPVAPGAKLILTVHDELAFEVPSEHVETAKAVIKQAMETVWPFDVPLLVEVGAGPNWAESKG